MLYYNYKVKYVSSTKLPLFSYFYCQGDLVYGKLEFVI